MIDWYCGLPWQLRGGIGLVFLLISTALWFADIFWPWGWALGVALLLFAFPSKAERKGYHDF
jgi:hypothetical protein